MSMTSREQFEAWLQPYWSRSTFTDDDGEEQYRDELVQGAWMGWKAASKASEQQPSESRREFTAANATIHNLELKVVQAVAENAGLKELIEQHAGSIAVCPNCSHEEPSETDDIVALYRSLETPATDAYLADAEARGVDKFATELGHVYQQLRPGSNHTHAIKSAVFRAVEFAAQLRQGAEHD
ncbi:hypothetical protein LZ634_04100 [Kluyvera intermedia]|uniref:hypothetical protein n=1 Tax=Kluyvera intermedia TaxID=61648 RepID=UPI001F32579E|nr:hypothetical protein [Kluyvera intermedia]MCE9887893.1 hypothetical protein [Kluyvera intermedia]